MRAATAGAGSGRFIDDLGTPPGALHAAFLRSPHAHARLGRIDLDAARRAPGVVAVFTGDGLAEIPARSWSPARRRPGSIAALAARRSICAPAG
ncbi:MAG: hypothetical protein R3F54_31785 [Alphaproteobacteria bacterium]